MNLNTILSKTLLITVLFLYLCLRSQEQCLEGPAGPHSDFLTINQKSIKAVPQSATNPEHQSITVTITPYPNVVYLEPAIQELPKIYHIITGIIFSAGCNEERAPPA